MPIGLLGKKLGMGQVFDEKGTLIPVTLIQAGPCAIVEKRTTDRDGYVAVQLGFDEKPDRKRTLNSPDRGRFAKAGVKPRRYVREFRVEDNAAYEVGQELDVKIFEKGELVDVTGTSKGRGFAGPHQRHGSTPGPVSHGSMYHNRPGSNGGSSQPARTFPGKKMAGHMGDVRVTVKNLTIVGVDPDKNILLVRGSVPGANRGYVMIKKSK